ncbi:unnamed protein product [Caenorhabditis auriculariae]|uniref:Uncharacterized protein n=1 Tax=Caenorhabditis auriculariae TaxID=2777116 RepID=A0A8S1HMG5_9PELO|nr:unnamed protein product [Caenorhabditis auriculariae]
MPLDPMDVMWMSKAPTVSELVVESNVTFKPVLPSAANGPVSPMPAATADDSVRPDFDTDVLWKPRTRLMHKKERTISMDSTDSEMYGARKMSLNESIGSASPQPPTSPVEAQPRQRRMSISEMLFGSSPSSFSWGISTTQTTEQPTDRKLSISEDPRFKDFMKHQSKILGDDGISGGFKRRDYMHD